MSQVPTTLSSIPLYEQAATRIRNDIVSGRLQSGDRLPPIRKYAEELGVSRLTVHRAYCILSDEGIVFGQPGSGTFVAQLNNRELSKKVLGKFTQSGPMIEFEQVCRQSQIRSFATPLPDGSLWDLRDYFANQMILCQEDSWNSYLAEWGGEGELRREFVPLFRRLGIELEPSDLVLVNGGGVTDLFFKFAVEPGDAVLIDEPWGLLLLKRFEQLGIRPVGFDPSRTSPEALADLIERENIQAVLACPHYGFATGIGWHDSLIRTLYEQAQIRSMQLYFGMSFGLLPYQQPRMLPEVPKGVNVWYGISLPFLTASTLQANIISVPKEIGDIVRSPQYVLEGMTRIAQLALARFMSTNLSRQLEHVREEYEKRASWLYHSLKSNLTCDAEVLRPQGGYGLTVRLPERPDALALFNNSLEESVAVMPGEYVCSNPENFVNLRLLFNNVKLSEIDDAAERVAKAINRTLR